MLFQNYDVIAQQGHIGVIRMLENGFMLNESLKGKDTIYSHSIITHWLDIYSDGDLLNSELLI